MLSQKLVNSFLWWGILLAYFFVTRQETVAFAEVGFGPAGLFTLSIQTLELLPDFPPTDIPSIHKPMFFGESYRYSESSSILRTDLEKMPWNLLSELRCAIREFCSFLLIMVANCMPLAEQNLWAPNQVI